MSITLTGDIGTIIVSVGTLCGVLGSLYLQYRNLKQSVDNAKNIQRTANKADENMGAIRETSQKVEAIHATTNGLTEQLVASTKIIAHAAGVKEEQDRRAVLDTSHVGTMEDPIHVQLVPHDAGAQDDLQWTKPK